MDEINPDEIKPDAVVEPELLSDELDEPEASAAAGLSHSWQMVLVGVVMLLVGGFLGYMGRPVFGPEAKAARLTATAGVVAAQTSAAADAVAVQTRAVANQDIMKYLVGQVRHWKGDANAPVVLIEFSDFQCPYCGRWAAEAGRQIEEEYVKTGKVRLGYWNFAFLGDESKWAAEAAECAADQDKFWEFHDLTFSRQNGENQGAFSKDNLKKLAAELKLDTAAFNECLDSDKYASLIDSVTAAGQQIGVRSTPSFVVNGTPLVGAQPFEVFSQLIQQFLGK